MVTQFATLSVVVSHVVAVFVFGKKKESNFPKKLNQFINKQFGINTNLGCLF